MPSREQLMFMAEFADHKGEFVDPFELQQIHELTDETEALGATPAESTNPPRSEGGEHELDRH